CFVVVFVFEEYSLPGVENPQQESLAFRSISAATLASEIRRLGQEGFNRRYMLVDCRYPYEYDGGHVMLWNSVFVFASWEQHGWGITASQYFVVIDSAAFIKNFFREFGRTLVASQKARFMYAVNIHDHSDLESIFFPEDPHHPIRSRIPIFYCEFSQKRGPAMALALRSLDRKRNELDYPKVDYAEMYLLDQGYRKFWNDGSYKMCTELETNTELVVSPTAKTPDVLPRRLEFNESLDFRNAE
uniref:Rhodanese domain-containing protein n=1 Tax=Angiostrongylus cantonensis TaxID=6313 RepID=A0A0K0CUK3_ANGCA